MSRSISYYETPPTQKDFILKDLNDNIQKEYLLSLAQKINSLPLSDDDKARVAISLVQQIPYDYQGFESGELTGKYPYEVLYTLSGVCGEKTELLLFLLRELDYGTAYFSFDLENHAVVGIKCDVQYDYRDTGYCFVEASGPTIPTFKSGKYVGVGYIESIPEVIPISDGKTFDASEEFEDALYYEKLMQMGPTLPAREYNIWLKLTKKYGLE